MSIWLATVCWMPVYGFGMWTSYGDQQCVTKTFQREESCRQVQKNMEAQKERLWNHGTFKSRWESLGRYATCEEKKI